jgi:hypothetical protein
VDVVSLQKQKAPQEAPGGPKFEKPKKKKGCRKTATHKVATKRGETM